MVKRKKRADAFLFQRRQPFFTFLPFYFFTFKKPFYFLFSSMFEGMSSKISLMRFVSNLGVRS